MSRPRVVVAPDSFKGGLPSAAVCAVTALAEQAVRLFAR
ncbi:glycerate kinase [Actinomadura sp. KC06]|nr:glycerate kinase [Actinomadura sp. KC06]